MRGINIPELSVEELATCVMLGLNDRPVTTSFVLNIIVPCVLENCVLMLDQRHSNRQGVSFFWTFFLKKNGDLKNSIKCMYSRNALAVVMQ
jgi:hypothetical protein